MRLLPTHIAAVEKLIIEARLELRRFNFGYNSTEGRSQITFAESSHSYYFYIGTKRGPTGNQYFQLTFSPGDAFAVEKALNGEWNGRSGVLQRIEKWLQSIRGELAASSRNRGETSPPKWLTTDSPGDLEHLRSELGRLEAQIATLEERFSILWQTGDALNTAVANIFNDLGYTATLTKPGTTYDVLVQVDRDKRFLAEVTGIEGQLSKAKGGKIAQLVDASLIADAQDRLLLIVNAFRATPPAARSKDIVTADALRPITALEANVVSTVTLYEIWNLARSDREAARARMSALHAQAGGLFT